MYNRHFIREITLFSLNVIVVLTCFILFFITIPYNSYELNTVSSYYEIHRYTRVITLYPFLLGILLLKIIFTFYNYFHSGTKRNAKKTILFVIEITILVLVFILFVFVFLFLGIICMKCWDYTGIGNWNIYKFWSNS